MFVVCYTAGKLFPFIFLYKSSANTQEATKLIIDHQELFTDYEVVKGGMDDVFLAVTGKKLGGER